MKRSPRIAVVGERDATPERAREAEYVGREIAQRGGVLICGGMGGVMEAAARGCALARGIVVGILPGSLASDANDWVSIPIVTAMGEGRNVIIVRSAQAVIAIGGSYGTLSEIALALRLQVPVIGLHTWTFSSGDQSIDDPIVRVQSASAAVEAAWQAVATP